MSIVIRNDSKTLGHVGGGVPLRPGYHHFLNITVNKGLIGVINYFDNPKRETRLTFPIIIPSTGTLFKDCITSEFDSLFLSLTRKTR